MKKARLNRLFNKSGKCFDVAIDHGFFNEHSFLSGIENMSRAIETIVAANPDAIQLSPGLAPFLQNISGKTKPALVLRTDIANCYNPPRHTVLWSELIASPVEQAVRLDATCVVVNLLEIPQEPEISRQCIRNINQLKLECETYGMPLMIEPLVMQGQAQGGYGVDGNLNKILPLVRQAVELGADIIKADPCTNIEEYHRVIEIAQQIPVLVRGGSKASDAEILTRTEALMRQGACGIVYGRNVIQHKNPAGITRALMAIVHDETPAEEALKML